MATVANGQHRERSCATDAHTSLLLQFVIKGY
jgi:hypothetical protein